MMIDYHKLTQNAIHFMRIIKKLTQNARLVLTLRQAGVTINLRNT